MGDPEAPRRPAPGRESGPGVARGVDARGLPGGVACTGGMGWADIGSGAFRRSPVDPGTAGFGPAPGRLHRLALPALSPLGGTALRRSRFRRGAMVQERIRGNVRLVRLDSFPRTGPQSAEDVAAPRCGAKRGIPVGCAAQGAEASRTVIVPRGIPSTIQMLAAAAG